MNNTENLEVEIERLKKEIEKLRDYNKILNLLGEKFRLSMHCAIIEADHGKGNAAGMEWINNAFAVSGDFPPDSETNAEAYFQRNSVESELEECFNLFV